MGWLRTGEMELQCCELGRNSGRLLVGGEGLGDRWCTDDWYAWSIWDWVVERVVDCASVIFMEFEWEYGLGGNDN